MGITQFISKIKVKRSIIKCQKELSKELANGITYDFLYKIFSHISNLFDLEKSNNTFMLYDDYFNGIQIVVTVLPNNGIDKFGFMFEELEHISAFKYTRRNIGVYVVNDNRIFVSEEIIRYDVSDRRKEEYTYLFDKSINISGIRHKDFITPTVSTNVQLLEFNLDRYFKHLIDWIKEKSMVRL